MNIVHAHKTSCVFLFFLLFLGPQLPSAGDDPQKAQKKELESAAKKLNEEANSLEKSGKLVEASLKYAESLGYIELKDAAQAVSRLDETLKTNA